MQHVDLVQNRLVEDPRVDAFVESLKEVFRKHQLVLRLVPDLGRPILEAWQAGAGDYLDDALLGPGAAPSFLPHPSHRRKPQA